MRIRQSRTPVLSLVGVLAAALTACSTAPPTSGQATSPSDSHDKAVRGLVAIPGGPPECHRRRAAWFGPFRARRGSGPGRVRHAAEHRRSRAHRPRVKALNGAAALALVRDGVLSLG